MTEKFGFHTNVDGYNVFVQLNPFDKEVLQKYCATIQEPNCYVEIGTDEGGSALVAKGATKAPIYTIDIRKKYNFVDPDINFITERSEEVASKWDKPIGVLFIDGNHTEARQDFLAWERHVVPGGYILFHDYIPDDSFTVIKDCDELFFDNPNYELIYRPLGFNNTRIFIVKKK